MQPKIFKILSMFAVFFVGISSSSYALQSNDMDLINVSSDGYYDIADGHYSAFPKIAAEGRVTAFTSLSPMLVQGDSNGFADVFVHDSLNHTTEIVSISSSGQLGNGDSGKITTYIMSSSNTVAISADGRFVVFISNADNLVANDTNGFSDVFLRDRLLGTTTRVSVATNADQGTGDCRDVDISADGRFITFTSLADNFYAFDSNIAYDTFVYDRVTATTELVSVDNAGLPMPSGAGGWNVYGVSINADGRYVVFTSGTQLYLRDRTAGTTELVSISTAGELGNFTSGSPDISADGNFIAFTSHATNFAPNVSYGGLNIYVRDRSNNTTELITRSPYNNNGPGGFTNYPTISDNGRFVNFYTIGNNLIDPLNTQKWGSLIFDRVKKTFESVTGFNDYNRSDFTSMNGNGRFVAFRSAYYFVMYTANNYGMHVRDRAKDLDGDGYKAFEDIVVEDCNDNDAAINPAASEIPYNDIDENCNGMTDDDDVDGDDYGIATDYNDNDPAINPGATEIPYNGIDENCNGMTDDDDVDRDGYPLATDCNDNATTINPGATEVPYNGIDENCNGMTDDDDVDRDGYPLATDCSDSVFTINPGSMEVPYNSVDENCNGMVDDIDYDGDGYNYTVDCNDNASTINPTAYEIFNNGIDENCNGMTDDADATVMVDSTTDTVQQLPVEALLPPDSTGSTTDTTVAENRIGALQNMIAVVSDKLAAINNTMTDAEKLIVYNDCLVDLNAILYKTDGFYGGNPNNDWVTTQAGQALLYPQIQNTINFVQGEISKLTTP